MPDNLKLNIMKLSLDGGEMQEISSANFATCPRVNESIMLLGENDPGYYKVVHVMHVPGSELSDGSLMVIEDGELGAPVKKAVEEYYAKKST